MLVYECDSSYSGNPEQSTHNSFIDSVTKNYCMTPAIGFILKSRHLVYINNLSILLFRWAVGGQLKMFFPSSTGFDMI